MAPGLEVGAASVSHGRLRAVFDATISVPFGQLTAVVGPNAAGKTSLLAYLTGRAKGESASLTLDGDSIDGLAPRDRIRRGLVLVPQGRLLFPRLTVGENLRVVADALRLPPSALDGAADRFPVLGQRWSARAGNLSGGEQQMLAIARGLMCSPRMLLLDEPTLGLAPKVVSDLMSLISRLCAEGLGVLVAEPAMNKLPENIDAGWVMVRGRTVANATSRAQLSTAYSQAIGLQTPGAGPVDAGPR